MRAPPAQQNGKRMVPPNGNGYPLTFLNSQPVNNHPLLILDPARGLKTILKRNPAPLGVLLTEEVYPFIFNHLVFYSPSLVRWR